MIQGPSLTADAHTPVLLEEVIQALQVNADGNYVDCTFGRGGHSIEIVSRLGDKGRLLVFDRDPQAIAAAERNFGSDARVTWVQTSFANLADEVSRWQRVGMVNGVLLDLGLSSPQLDDAGRGFSFQHDGDLDMRFDPGTGISASMWLAKIAEDDLVDTLFRLGEERYARRIARALVSARASTPITRTLQLAKLVAGAVPTREKGKHPATRTFQAIRIAVNTELESLQDVLPQALEVLKIGGRLAVISFHSLEDRIVKRFFQQQRQGDHYPPELPVTASELAPRLRLVSRAIRASDAELRRNPRARSATLRVAEKIAA